MAEEEKKDAAPAQASAPSGGSKIVMIVAIVNLLATLGIGAVVFISFQKEKASQKAADLAHSESGEEPAHDGKEGAAAGGEHGGGGGGEHGGAGADKKSNSKFGKAVSLEQFTVNLSTSGSVTPKYVRVTMSLEVPSTDTEAEVTQKMAQVRNTIIDLFNSKRPSDLVNPEGREHLKEEIKNALNSFLVSGKVKGVFFTNFAVSS